MARRGDIVTRSHWLLVAVALTLARCSYDAGHRAGVEDGYWDCARRAWGGRMTLND